MGRRLLCDARDEASNHVISPRNRTFQWKEFSGQRERNMHEGHPKRKVEGTLIEGARNASTCFFFLFALCFWPCLLPGYWGFLARQ